MDSHSRGQWIVAVLVVVAALSFPLFAGSVYIYGGDFDLAIPADLDDTRGRMHDAVIEVGDRFKIHDLDVRIDVTHTNVFDLQIFLHRPSGTTLCLNMYNLSEYFEGENYIGTIFDDEADAAIEQGQAPFTGRFRPKDTDPFSLLAVFDGDDAFGPWHLQIQDMWYADTGTLNRFELIFAAPEPTTAILLFLALTLTGLSPRRRRRT